MKNKTNIKLKKGNKKKDWKKLNLSEFQTFYPQTFLKNDKIFPCFGSFGFPPFLLPALPVALEGAALPTAGDFFVGGGLNS